MEKRKNERKNGWIVFPLQLEEKKIKKEEKAAKL